MKLVDHVKGNEHAVKTLDAAHKLAADLKSNNYSVTDDDGSQLSRRIDGEEHAPQKNRRAPSDTTSET